MNFIIDGEQRLKRARNDPIHSAKKYESGQKEGKTEMRVTMKEETDSTRIIDGLLKYLFSAKG